MTASIPIGERENERLEFKSRDALKDLPSIGREVVAMLNGTGPSAIWIGLAEDEGTARELQPVDHAEWDRLWNHLVDTVEPSPTEKEVSHRMVSHGSGPGAVLRIDVTPTKRRPFAQLKQGGRFFWKRVGPRVRSMTREEIFEGARKSGSKGLTELTDKITGALEKRLAQGRAGLWLQIQPGNEDLILPISKKDFACYLQDASLTENRERGWNLINAYGTPTLSQGRLAQGTREDEPRIEVFKEGTIVGECPLEGLHWKGDEREIWPFALVEYVISTVRIASVLYKHTASALPGHVGAHFALFGLRGWQLRPGSPVGGYMSRHFRATCELDDFILARPLLFTEDEFLERPGSCAVRLLLPVYESFGFREEEMPPELDRRTGALALGG